MKHIDIVFDGPPDHHAPKFIEVEDDTGKSIKIGEWIHRGPGKYWVLRIKPDQLQWEDAYANDPACSGSDEPAG
jgi:hypothetical protein